jgi:hypothetical protein
VNFPVGAGGSDVIPHQIVRTNTDRLYIFANQQSSAVLRVYRTTSAGLPGNTTDFAAPVQLTEASNPLSVDAVYDGGNIIHMLINTQNGQIKDYPFSIVTNTFNTPITLATDGGTVSSGLYVGTSGVNGMIDTSGNLHIAYWTSGNHILHRAYTYNSSSNVLTPQGSFVQVDTAGGANHPAVAISPVNNSLTIAWVSQADNPPKIRTRTRASNGTWGSVQSASTASVWTSADSGINIDQGPSLIIDSSGKKHLTYIQSFDYTVGDYGRIHYVTDAGSGWVDQALNAFSHDPALTINSTGEIYIIGHGHPENSTCLSMSDMCVIKKSANGTWGSPQLFALHPSGSSFDSSPSVKWSVVGFNRPDTIEFIFFKTPYHTPTIYYGRIQKSSGGISISGNAGTAGVTLSYVDGTAKSVVTPTNGNYSFPVSLGWSGTVTPSHACFTFSPPNRTYSNITTIQMAQNYTPIFNSASGCADVDVVIGGTNQGKYGVPSNGQLRVEYALDAGPVEVASTNGVPIIAALRDSWKDNSTATWTSFVQMMGLPKEQLSDSYYFPSYNNVSLSGQLRFGNVDTVSTWVRVVIGGVERGRYFLDPSEQVRVEYDLDSGPVVVESETAGVKIIAALRDSWNDGRRWTSYAEMMGLPKESLSDSYYFPSYNNINLSGQLRFGNVDTVGTWVRVVIGGVQRGRYFLDPSEQTRVEYDLDSGPVMIESETAGVKIIAALRDAWFDGVSWTSYVQMIGLPKESLSDTYYLPAYNNINLSGQLRFGNVDTVGTWVRVVIGGVQRGRYFLDPSEQVRVEYALDSGPVVIESETAGVQIIAALRDAWWDGKRWTSFAQMMGLPSLSDTYYFPSYNNVSLSGQLRFGAP